MARRPRSAKLETRTARLKLAIAKKPIFVTVAPGVGLGYRRNQGAGTWVVRAANGRGGNWTKAFALADDHEEADGEHALDYWQAQDRARVLARGQDVEGERPGSVEETLTAYEDDLRARGGLTSNVSRVRHHLTPALADKAVALLSTRELRRWRDGLIAKRLAPATVNRICGAFQAALELAAKHDQRIANVAAWRVGLASIPDAHRARNVILTDDEVRRLVTAAHEIEPKLGLLVETLAGTGARVSQVARLEVGDLQDNRRDSRVMMPSSRKGRGRKRIERKPVPITAGLAAKLRQAAGGRSSSEPLLRKADDSAWSHGANHEYRKPFAEAVEGAKLASNVTANALRHSSIVRQLIAGVPVRIVAAVHDTSIVMIERTYSQHIGEHSDVIVRRALLDLSSRSPADNVVPLVKG